MGYYTTPPDCECRGKTHPPSKNRVVVFSTSVPVCTRRSAPQVLESHREKRPTPTIIVSGVRYYGYRYYSPELGRWMSRDPIAERGGVNLYALIANKGINETDLLGMKSLKQWFVELLIVASTKFTDIYPPMPGPPPDDSKKHPPIETPNVKGSGKATLCAATAAGAYALAYAAAMSSVQAKVVELGLALLAIAIEDAETLMMGPCCDQPDGT